MANATLHLTHDQPAAHVHVVRFVRPDLRPQLDPVVGDDNVLYREIVATLDDLKPGSHVVFNCGLVERFPSAFFQLFMKVRQFVLAKQGHITLCCFRPEILPSVELMGGARLFTIAASEESAVHAARDK